MSASLKLRWKRYVNKLRFMHDESDLIEQISDKTGNEFQAYLQDYCIDQGINLKALNRDHSDKVEEAYRDLRQEKTKHNLLIGENDEEQQSIQHRPKEPVTENKEVLRDESEIHDVFNKLFKKIALFLHPDRLGSEISEEQKGEYLLMFNEAKESLEQKKYFVLLELAEKFGVAAPKNYEQQIRWMKKSLGALTLKVEEKKTTYNYLFSECETRDEKDEIVKKFIRQLFGI